MTRASLPAPSLQKSRESRWPSLCTWPRRPRGEAEPYHPFARRAGIVARRTDGFAVAMRRGDTMTRITHRPQPSGAMNVDSAREPARRAVDAAIGLSARTEKAKEGNARLITSLLASVLL